MQFPASIDPHQEELIRGGQSPGLLCISVNNGTISSSSGKTISSERLRQLLQRKGAGSAPWRLIRLWLMA